MPANTTWFPDSRHVNIQNSQFTTTQTTIIRSPALDPALKILRKNRASEASHTSKTAASAPKCKPGTQVKAINDITTWADDLPVDPSPPVESVLWLQGPAGAGKTCILREVTCICHKRGTLAGDYFFSTRVPGLDNEAPFVATIVSHLIEAIPALDHPVLQTIRSNPTIFEQSLEYQIEKLISDHTTSIPPQSPAPRILVIDGFDECRDPDQRAHLLHLLHSLVTPPHSFRVIMASRPELDIRTAFDQPPLKSMTKILHLEDYDTSGEIYQYLSDEFARIRETHPAKQSIPSEWPGRGTLHALTDKSSRIWVYPTTVIKYVDNPRRHPVELLKHVIDASSNASSGRPFAELDALYETILNPPGTDILLMKRLLHVVVEITCALAPIMSSLVVLGSLPSIQEGSMQGIISTSALDEFLSLEKGTTEITLCDLHSILSVAGDSNRPWIYFHHKSLEDYLCSPERSANLYQPRQDTRSDILTVCIHNLQCWNRKLDSPNADFDSTLEYLCTIWDIFLVYFHIFPPSILDFDARIAWRCFAFASVGAYGLQKESLYKALVNDFHKSMCKGKAECWQFCASFRRMLEYRPRLLKVIKIYSEAPPMDRLKRFEEECHGLFDGPLDLSPPAVGAFAITGHRKRPSAPLPPLPEIPSASGSGTPPPEKSSELGSGEVTGVHLTPESPPAHSSVRLAPIFIWLVLPVFVASLDIYILRQTISPPF